MKHRPLVILTKFGQNRPKNVGALGFWKMSFFKRSLTFVTPTWPLEKIWAESLKGRGPVVILTKFGQNRPKNVGAVGFWKLSNEEI